jgi:hypothetical protein
MQGTEFGRGHDSCGLNWEGIIERLYFRLVLVPIAVQRRPLLPNSVGSLLKISAQDLANLQARSRVSLRPSRQGIETAL